MRNYIVVLLIASLTSLMMIGCGPNQGVATVDAVTTASIVDNGKALIKALGPDGTWIACTLKDLVLTEDLIVEGSFNNKDLPARAIALYTADANRKITAQFKLTAPKMIIRSENTKIQGGTFVGDIYIEAKGFQIGPDATVEGNLYFENQAYMDSFILDDKGILKGTKALK